jgi:predicted short-subunit dehydrogenase-like oxidoreductase (DUF2520 family)
MSMQVVIIGSGNTATILGKLLKKNGFHISQVISRNIAHAEILANALNCSASDFTSPMDETADIYLIAVSDKIIHEVVNHIPKNNKLILHTAGSVSINVLKNVSNQFGVLYPLQSLRKEIANSPEIPFLIEGNNQEVSDKIMLIAQKISNQVAIANDEMRLKLHLSAVFVNNFTNHLYTMIADYCRKEQLEFDLLKPLIFETANRLKFVRPNVVQTGPAIRNDASTIERHDQLLENYPELKEMYTYFTKQISSFYL